MRFCLQCGTSLSPSPSPPPPPARVDTPRPAGVGVPPGRPPAPVPRAPMAAPPHKETHTVPLKIAATPVMSPRPGGVAAPARPSLGDHSAELDDESLKKSFERQVTQPGAVVCRFCKGPLDIAGEFCEQCGAPVAEAAPPGMIKPKPQPVATPHPPSAAPAPPPTKPAGAPSLASPPPPPRPIAPPPPQAKPPALSDTAHTRQPLVPPPAAPSAPPTPPADDQSSGLMGRFKGLFKKG
jgi:hypothetical protein